MKSDGWPARDRPRAGRARVFQRFPIIAFAKTNMLVDPAGRDRHPACHGPTPRRRSARCETRRRDPAGPGPLTWAARGAVRARGGGGARLSGSVVSGRRGVRPRSGRSPRRPCPLSLGEAVAGPGPEGSAYAGPSPRHPIRDRAGRFRRRRARYGNHASHAPRRRCVPLSLPRRPPHPSQGAADQAEATVPALRRRLLSARDGRRRRGRTCFGALLSRANPM